MHSGPRKPFEKKRFFAFVVSHEREFNKNTLNRRRHFYTHLWVYSSWLSLNVLKSSLRRPRSRSSGPSVPESTTTWTRTSPRLIASSKLRKFSHRHFISSFVFYSTASGFRISVALCLDAQTRRSSIWMNHETKVFVIFRFCSSLRRSGGVLRHRRVHLFSDATVDLSPKRPKRGEKKDETSIFCAKGRDFFSKKRLYKNKRESWN